MMMSVLVSASFPHNSQTWHIELEFCIWLCVKKRQLKASAVEPPFNYNANFKIIFLLHKRHILDSKLLFHINRLLAAWFKEVDL